MDNCGLVHYVYRRLGMEMPRSVAAQAQVGQAVSKNDLPWRSGLLQFSQLQQGIACWYLSGSG